ncbi:hypothetical protein PCAR4_290066 [Paraburkholderia caribensis]|nr:hypothetical protein PCAR4_290066 [Paraburkholderia caribensis]
MENTFEGSGGLLQTYLRSLRGQQSGYLEGANGGIAELPGGVHRTTRVKRMRWRPHYRRRAISQKPAGASICFRHQETGHEQT